LEHLRVAHKIAQNGILITDPPSPANSDDSSSSTQCYNLVTPFLAGQWKAAFMEWVLVDDITFRQSSSAKLKSLFSSLNPLVEPLFPDSHNTTRQWVLDLYKEKKPLIRTQVANAKSQIHLTFDGWKARNGLEVLGVVAHFMDANWDLKIVPLGLPVFPGRKTGENMSMMVTQMMKEFDIAGHRLGYLNSDNAYPNDTCLQFLGVEFGFEWEEKRLRCLGHVINLVAKAMVLGEGCSKWEKELQAAGTDLKSDLWRQMGPIGKLVNMATIINKSSESQRLFKSYAEEDGMESICKVISRMGVHWNDVWLLVRRGKFDSSERFAHVLFC
jgi:hypothetical protein